MQQTHPNYVQDVAKVIEWSGEAPQQERFALLVNALQMDAIPRVLLLDEAMKRSQHHRLVQLLREQGLIGQEDQAVTSAVNAVDQGYVRAAAEEARRQLREKESSANEFKTRITKLESTLNFDFGPNATLIHLLDKEFTHQSGEYLFKFKPFDICEQGSTSLGKYTSWKALDAAQDVIPQELNEGPGIPKPSILMKFENGLRCYQGTIRSATVYMRCGKDDAIVSVFEPEVCRYVYLFKTPVACVTSEVLLEATRPKPWYRRIFSWLF